MGGIEWGLPNLRFKPDEGAWPKRRLRISPPMSMDFCNLPTASATPTAAQAPGLTTGLVSRPARRSQRLSKHPFRVVPAHRHIACSATPSRDRPCAGSYPHRRVIRSRSAAASGHAWGFHEPLAFFAITLATASGRVSTNSILRLGRPSSRRTGSPPQSSARRGIRWRLLVPTF